jgi:carbohydrate-selective porin OprB
LGVQKLKGEVSKALAKEIPLASILYRTVMYLLTCAAMSFYPMAAQQTAPERHVAWRDRASLTGDWDGTRDELEDKGLMLRAHFVAESAANPTGGKSQTARYTRN